MSKSPEAFRTIGEVSEELDVPKHVLRFWESKFAQLKPMKRGGNRRYYRPEDIELLRGIRTLLHDEGYTIRGLQRVIRQQGVSYVKNYWRAPRAHSAAQGKPALPDLAGETAGHARKAALEQAKSQARPQRLQSAARNAPRAPALSAEQQQTLETALSELEQCRHLLASARSSSHAVT